MGSSPYLYHLAVQAHATKEQTLYILHDYEKGIGL